MLRHYNVNACRFRGVLLMISTLLSVAIAGDLKVITGSGGHNALISKCCGPQQTLWWLHGNDLPTRYECRSDGSASRTHIQHHCAWAVEMVDIGESSDDRAFVGVFCFDQLGNGESRETTTDRVVGLKCNVHTDSEAAASTAAFAVHRLAKCCPSDSRYDLTSRSCVATTDGSADLEALRRVLFRSERDDNVILLEQHKPQCNDATDVFVEYLSGRHSMRMHNNNGLDLWSVQHGESEHLEAGSFCVDATIDAAASTDAADASAQQQQLIVRSCRKRAICERIACIRRCCGHDQLLQTQNGSSVCVPYERNLLPRFYDVPAPLSDDLAVAPAPTEIEAPEYGIIPMQTCVWYVLDDSDPDDASYINHKNGYLHFYGAGYGPDLYCTEFVNRSGTITADTFMCFPENIQTKYQYYAVGLSISAVFLLLTLLVYITLPKLLNLHGKTLLCYVCSLLIGYVALAYAQSSETTDNCYVIGYIIYFGFMASFCWQSIMCFDIYWTFGSMRTSRGLQKAKELRRFLLYSLYAWGVAVLLTSVTMLFDVNAWLPDGWNPNLITDDKCWFQSINNREKVGVAQLVFFLLPMGLHIGTNAVLFALTAHHCSKVKGDIHRMQAKSDAGRKSRKKFLALREKYVMNAKLFVVMGVSWLLELVATVFFKQSVMWYFSDSFNILQGVLVFLIFVFKWKVWHAIRKRLGFPATEGASSSAGSNATATTPAAAALAASTVRLDRIGGHGEGITPDSGKLISRSNVQHAEDSITVNLSDRVHKVE